MNVPRSVSEVLSDHVTLEVEGIDRMYLNVYVPQWQRELGVVGFFRYHRGHQFVSSALMDPISKNFVAALEAFATREQVPVVQFRKGQRKDEVAAEHLIRSCDQTSRNGEESKSSRHRPTRVSAGGAEVAATHPLQGRHTEHNGQRIACWQALTGSALCQSGQPEFLLV